MCVDDVGRAFLQRARVQTVSRCLSWCVHEHLHQTFGKRPQNEAPLTDRNAPELHAGMLALR